jgi:glycosyltransferase involved in cell wall biosynthesis
MKCPIKQLKVSVVVPTYNRATLVTRAIISVLSQCYEEDEVIVVDDHSDDDTEKQLELYGDRIIYRKVPHGGAGKARNIGLGLAKNPLIAFLDSDDEWMPGKLELQRAIFESRPDVLFCFTDFKYRLFSGREERFRLRSWHGDDWPQKGLGLGIPFSSLVPFAKVKKDFEVHIGDLYPLQMEKEYVQVGTLVVRREAIGDDIRFAEDLETREEWEFVGKLAGRGPAAFFDLETEIVYRHEGIQITKIDEILLKEKKENTNLLQARLKILRRVWGSDPEFLKRNSLRYQNVYDKLQMRLIKGFLAAGRPQEARNVIAQSPQAPVALRILSLLPSRWTVYLLRLRRFLKKRMWNES